MGNLGNFTAGHPRIAIFEVKIRYRFGFLFILEFRGGLIGGVKFTQTSLKRREINGSQELRNACYRVNSKTIHRNLRSAAFLGRFVSGGGLLIFLNRTRVLKDTERSPSMRGGILAGSTIYWGYSGIGSPKYTHCKSKRCKFGRVAASRSLLRDSRFRICLKRFSSCGGCLSLCASRKYLGFSQSPREPWVRRIISVSYELGNALLWPEDNISCDFGIYASEAMYYLHCRLN